MGRVRSVVVGAAASCALTGCSVLIDLSDLRSDGSTPNDSGTNDVVVVTDATDDEAEVATGPCAFTSVQAVPGTSLGQVMSKNPTAQQSIVESGGDLLVAIAYGGQNPGQTIPPTTAPNMTFSVSDTVGNTWYAAPMVENSRSNQAAIQIFYAANIQAGANVVTVTSSAQGLTLWTGMFLQEYSGAAKTNVVDVSSGQMAPSSSLAIAPPTMTTRTSCDLVVGAFTDGHVPGQPISPFAGWVKRSSDEWDPGGAFDDAPTPAMLGAKVVGGMNLSANADDGWVAQQVAFRGQFTSPLAQPDSLAFTTPPQTVKSGTCSPAVTIESRAASVAASTATGITMTLSAPSVTFYIDAACAFPISSLFIGAGTSSQSFHFKGTTGSPSISASASGFAPAIQSETIN
jgi:hypothetical protein